MTLEMRLAEQIAVNAVILGEGAGQQAPSVYHVIETVAQVADWLEMSEDDLDRLMAGVVCRNWNECEVTGD